MNALKVTMIVLALAILMGCAGVERKYRNCLFKALDKYSFAVMRLDIRKTGDYKCEEMDVTKELLEVSIYKDPKFYYCGQATPMSEEDYAHLLHMYGETFESKVRACTK